MRCSTQLFALKHETCPPITLNSQPIPRSEEAKYLGVHLDKRLTWKTHNFTKRKALGIRLRNLYWLLLPNSKLSLENKMLIYKTILKPVWAYGIQLWEQHPTPTSKYFKDSNQKLLEEL